jgi:hypothetical protein
MFGWIPVVLYLFSRFPAQRAIVVSFVTGFLFLPQLFKFPIAQGIPAYDKVSATSYCVLLATLLFDAGRFSSFKPGWLDLPMLIWCLCPIATQISNGLSPISPTTGQIVTWGIPYFLGSNLSQRPSRTAPVGNWHLCWWVELHSFMSA